VTVAGEGKRQPEVDNKSKEGRFINRRVSLRVTDGQGRLVKDGGIRDVIQAMQDQLGKKQQECCDAILKRLDKLDDILRRSRPSRAKTRRSRRVGPTSATRSTRCATGSRTRPSR